MLSVVISLQTQPRRSTKRVSWSRRVPVCQHRSIFASCSYQRSTFAYMEQSPAELRSLDVSGRFTSEHCCLHIAIGMQQFANRFANGCE